MPEHLYAFASDKGHFDLTARSSLHDAWLESLTVREEASGSRNEVRRLEVSICLLGPYHDRLIHLRYSGVERYLFDAPNRTDVARFDHTAHGDLYTHEIRLVRDGLFVHEFVFERGGTLLVEFSEFSHRQELLTSTP